jgi:hypothetical protein
MIPGTYLYVYPCFTSIIPRGLSSFFDHASVVTHMSQGSGLIYNYGTRHLVRLSRASGVSAVR